MRHHYHHEPIDAKHTIPIPKYLLVIWYVLEHMRCKHGILALVWERQTGAIIAWVIEVNPNGGLGDWNSLRIAAAETDVQYPGTREVLVDKSLSRSPRI
jgi:hypothetical protein